MNKMMEPCVCVFHTDGFIIRILRAGDSYVSTIGRSRGSNLFWTNRKCERKMQLKI